MNEYLAGITSVWLYQMKKNPRQKCKKSRKSRKIRTNAHERYLAGAKKRTEIPGENEGEI